MTSTLRATARGVFHFASASRAPLFVPGQNSPQASFVLRQRLMHRHGASARVGKNDFHTVIHQRFYDDVGSRHDGSFSFCGQGHGHTVLRVGWWVSHGLRQLGSLSSNYITRIKKGRTAIPSSLAMLPAYPLRPLNLANSYDILTQQATSCRTWIGH